MKYLLPILAVIIPLIITFGIIYRVEEYSQIVKQKNYHTEQEITLLKTRVGLLETMQTQEIQEVTVKIVCIHEICGGLSDNIECINKCISLYNLK